MKLLVVLYATIFVALAMNSDGEEWKNFKLKYHKLYKSSRDEVKRFAIFQENLQTIQKHNEKYEAGLTTYKMGVNKFADLTPQEFQSYLKASGPMPKMDSVLQPKLKQIPEDISTVDWREKNAISPVKDQGNCGSCWSFAATGAMESQNFLKTNEMKLFSEQCLVDCSKPENNGCLGGSASSALEYARLNGLPTEAEYPYEAVNGQCRYKGNGTKITEVLQVVRSSGSSENKEVELRDAVASLGPIAVSVDATNFHLYDSGIFDDQECSNVFHNHGVLVSGYGTENGNDYWLVKNSWAADWGEEGYLRMRRNQDNQCGIANWCYVPSI